MKRNETRPVYVGNLQIGGQNKCILQSMTNVPAKNVEETIPVFRVSHHGFLELSI